MLPTVAICVKVTPSGERSILNPVSLLELSLQARLIWPVDTAVVLKLIGAAGRPAPPTCTVLAPLFELVTVSVAVTDWLPLVTRVTPLLKACAP